MFIFYRYRDHRNPPGVENKYDFNEEYWHLLSIRFAFVLIFEVSKNFILFIFWMWFCYFSIFHLFTTPLLKLITTVFFLYLFPLFNVSTLIFSVYFTFWHLICFPLYMLEISCYQKFQFIIIIKFISLNNQFIYINQ